MEQEQQDKVMLVVMLKLAVLFIQVAAVVLVRLVAVAQVDH